MALLTHIDTVAGDDDADESRSRRRAREMVALRESGRGLDEIALVFGISRERVRQILGSHGGPDALQVADARRCRIEQQVEAHIDELLRMWRAGQAPSSAADALGLQAAACRRAIARAATPADRSARRASLARARPTPKRYSDGDILVALTAVATRLGRPPSAKEYGALARDLEYPSLATVLNRMGGWTNAVHAAGLSPPGPAPRTRSRRWTVEACWSAVRRSVVELGAIPTVAGYDRHAAGRIDLPSSATLRNRLGRWSQITAQLAIEGEPAPHPRRERARSQLATAADRRWRAKPAA